MEDIGFLMVQTFLLLILAELLGWIVKRFGLPDIVGFIFAGIIFVNLTIFVPEVGVLLHFDIDEVQGNPEHFINVMGQLGLVFLLFSIGLETRLSELLNIGKVAFTVASMGIVVPFVGGYFAYYLFGADQAAAIMMGTSIFAMSTVVCVNILSYMKVLDTDTGKLIVGIAIFSDIICLVMLAVNSSIVSPVHEHALWMNILIILLFVVLALVFIYFTAHRAGLRQGVVERLNMDMRKVNVFILGFLLCLGFTATSYLVGLSGIVGAFFAGMYLAEFEDTKIKREFDALTQFMLPFFFIYVGLNLRFDQMSAHTLVIAVVIGIVAIVTKYVGGYIGCRMCRMEKSMSGFVASCMIARGDIAIVVATMAYGIGLFNTDMYAALILVAVITQIAAPIIAKKKATAAGIQRPQDGEEGAEDQTRLSCRGWSPRSGCTSSARSTRRSCRPRRR